MKSLLITILLLISLNCQAGKISNMYDSLLKYKVYEPEISLCIIILESGWMQCHDCALDNNNFFAFLWKGKYKSFRDYKHAILYYKKWQEKWYVPYHRRTGKDYYSFLKWINYAPNMDNYNRQLKIVRGEIKVN